MITFYSHILAAHALQVDLVYANGWPQEPPVLHEILDEVSLVSAHSDKHTELCTYSYHVWADTPLVTLAKAVAELNPDSAEITGLGKLTL